MYSPCYITAYKQLRKGKGRCLAWTYSNITYKRHWCIVHEDTTKMPK